MIISHKHKFIFIKPAKVAGTSVELNLSKNCGTNDIITPLNNYNKKSDSDFYIDYSCNYGRFKSHNTPNKLKTMIDKKIWDTYLKITIIRNPFDLVISRYYWLLFKKKKNIKYYFKNNKFKLLIIEILSFLNLFFRFGYYVNNFNFKWKNTHFYLDENNNKICDYYLRFENIDEDYKLLCKKLNLKYEKLPLIKNKQRIKKKHYSKYFNQKQIKKLNLMFENELKIFNYKF